ncbi:hypothetical protein OPS25_15700 [Alteromonas ponticola]|uniref:DUF4340 domain-containing protein n=1 Tax=Alteromonas aquimaris TaxID=2998417 RepID=A0ABT3PBJ6_9ALTE|nr:hypothetical protein [Alteromonas aquimaris]MCW8109950.1 hypothetical protein [Alteromonas aquimaris]
MARLSSKAMNNIVIFSMLIMIALFNLDTLLPKSTPAKNRNLLPVDAYILKIETDAGRIERNGQRWRQITPNEHPLVSPEKQIEAWQSAVIEPVDTTTVDLSNRAPIIAVVWLAGKPDGLVFAFYQLEQATFVRYENEWYQLTQSALETLIPWLADLTYQES